MDERQLCELSRGHAQHAFRLCLRHRLHHGLPRGYIQKNVGKGRDEKVIDLEISLLLHWAGIPKFHSGHYCRDSKSLLDGRADGDDRGLRRLFM